MTKIIEPPKGKTLVSFENKHIRPNKFFVQNYVANAEERYEVKKYLRAQHKRHQHHFVHCLWKHTRLSKQEIAWLLELSLSTVVDILKKDGGVVRDSTTKTRNDNGRYRGVMNAEFLQQIALNGILHFIETGNVTEKDINKMQTDSAYKALKMYELETSGIVSKTNAEAYQKHFGALKEGFALLKDAQGVLSYKDKRELEIKEKLTNIKLEQLELEKKGKNVAVTIIEEYGDNGVLADADLIYLMKDFLMKVGHTQDQIAMITKKALATVHHRKGQINDEEYNTIISGVETKFNDIEI